MAAGYADPWSYPGVVLSECSVLAVLHSEVFCASVDGSVMSSRIMVHLMVMRLPLTPCRSPIVGRTLSALTIVLLLGPVHLVSVSV